jgi:hypothetical protein
MRLVRSEKMKLVWSPLDPVLEYERGSQSCYGIWYQILVREERIL